MSPLSDAMGEPASRIDQPAGPSHARPFYWSVRRELWETRSVYVAPLIVAGLVLFGFLISLAHPSHFHHDFNTLDPARQAELRAMPYDFAAFAVFVTVFLVAVFYCLGALHGERRDRSILFWKSLPVSDLTAVLAKAAIPMLVLPAVAFSVVVALQAVMLALNTASALGHGQDVSTLWAQLSLAQGWLALLYMLVAVALWHAPIYAWLLLVSSWARRAPFLWAVLPPLGLGIVERIAFSTSHVGALIKDRLIGAFSQATVDGAFDHKPHAAAVDPLSKLDPIKFLGSPGLWIGLAVAAAFFAGAVWLRRRGEPI